MKQKKGIKLIIILAIILMLGLIKTTSCYATVIDWDDNKVNDNTITTHLENGGKVRISGVNLTQSNYLFCREQGISFSNTTNYSLEQNGVKRYPIITYYNSQNQDITSLCYDSEGHPTDEILNVDVEKINVYGADIAYVLSAIDDYRKQSGAKTYGIVQKAYWGVLSGYTEFNSNNEITNIQSLLSKDWTAYKLRIEAETYKNYLLKVEKYKVTKIQNQIENNIPKNEINTDYDIEVEESNSEIVYSIETYEDESKGTYQLATVGPFKIDYEGEWNGQTGRDFVSFGSLTLTFKNATGSSFTINDLKDGMYDIASLETNAIYFRYKEDNNKYKTVNAYIDSQGNIYTNTGLIDVGEEFYICFNLDKIKDSSSSKISLCISSSHIETSAEIYLLEGSYTGAYRYYSGEVVGAEYITNLCEECELKKDSSNTKTINGTSYIVGDTYYYWYKAGKCPGQYYDVVEGKYLTDTGLTPTGRVRTQEYLVCNKCDFKATTGGWHGYRGTCDGTLVKESITEYEYRVVYLKKIGCGKNIKYISYSAKEDTTYTGTIVCGKSSWRKWDEDLEIENQKIIIADSSKSIIPLEHEIDFSFIPPIDITLQKYNSYNATNKTTLSGAEFEITATQDGKSIISEEDNTVTIGQDGTLDYRITPNNITQPVYVTITETKAPNGYIAIKEPIQAMYIYNSVSKTWGPSYEQGEWKRVNDVNDVNDKDLPNTYESKSGDKIYVDEEESNGVHQVFIDVYNEAVIEKLKLLKIDATDNTKLEGAQFSGTITNVKSVEGLTLFPDENGRVTHNFTTNEKGEIILTNLVLINEGDPVEITIKEIGVPDSNSNDYYYKQLSEPITITITHSPTDGLTVIYEESEMVTVTKEENNSYAVNITIPNQRVIDIRGMVWLDGQTGIKPAKGPNGLIDSSESGVKGVEVSLYLVQGENESVIGRVVTGEDGTYNFEGIAYGGNYKVVFTYDGVNYEDTLYYTTVQNEKGQVIGDSKAQENTYERTSFNNKFSTITYNKATSTNNNKEITLEYSYIDRKSTLITTDIYGTAQTQYRMKAYSSEMEELKASQEINFGLVKRGTDIALSTDVYEAKVTINDQETAYTYNTTDESQKVKGPISTNEENNVTYNLNLYSSDYNYRIRDYITNGSFTKKDVMNSGIPENSKTGDELDAYVIYELNLHNQSTDDVYINEVQCENDLKCAYEPNLTAIYNEEKNGITHFQTDVKDNIITINLEALTLGDGTTKTLYLVFKVDKDENDNNNIETGEFSFEAEITSYSTTEGLIDNDSQPGNYFSQDQTEDDNDTANTIVVGTIPPPTENGTRIISGYVFENNDSKSKVNDVIVQLIELKQISGTTYEYIWQETVSGSGIGKRINSTGTALEEYTYEAETGKYEFQNFIPGDYIVRFIYGDGTTYDLTNNVTKYNGQDYKSMADANYNTEWYNNSTYTEGASVARDNEARRLETMAYSVNVDTKKGILLKLLDTINVDEFNETEKETLKKVYEDLEEPIETLTNEDLQVLLKDWVLPNTWMCAETSKIKVPVETENLNNISNATTVKGTETTDYVKEILNINLGLTKRPETKIELKKYITGFKLIASNDQVLVNASVDVNKYLDGTENISNEVQGIKDNLTILGTVWQYEVSPTEVNTVVEGAKLEYEYTLVVRNTGMTDYLSTTLKNAYNGQYERSVMTNFERESKELNYKNVLEYYMNLARTKQNGYTIGEYLGTAYYTGNETTSRTATVQTEVTSIRDYLNTNLSFISGKDTNGNAVTLVKDGENNAILTHRKLRDDYSMQDVKVNYLKTEATGKMTPGGDAVLYTITLGRDPITVTSEISFENYIAEVMSYTNAAGRRATTSTPANAEIIDAELREGRAHEEDEADTGRIQIGAKTGEDEQTNYILITAIAAGIVLIAAGAFVTKKYVIK